MTNGRLINNLNYQWQASIHFNWPKVGQYDVIFIGTIKSFKFKVKSYQSHPQYIKVNLFLKSFQNLPHTYLKQKIAPTWKNTKSPPIILNHNPHMTHKTLQVSSPSPLLYIPRPLLFSEIFFYYLILPSYI